MLTLVLFAMLAIGGAFAAWRSPWALLLFVPSLYWWAQRMVVITAFPTPELVWSLRVAVLFPLVGLVARRWHRRVPA
jgi:hypothetical protein